MPTKPLPAVEPGADRAMSPGRSLPPLLLLLLLLPPLLPAPEALAEEQGSMLLAPGLTVSYSVFTGIMSEKMGKTEASTFTDLVVYVVRSVRGARVDYDKLEVHVSMVFDIDKPFMLTHGTATLYSGPFWLDPKTLRGLKQGEEVQVKDPDTGEKTVYHVTYRGPLDVSGLNSSNKLPVELTGLPAPPGTVREVVVLSGSTKKGENHTMVADVELGLIYYEGYQRVEGKKGRTVVVSMLTGVNIDLESKLPSYASGRYNYGPLLRPGYLYAASWAHLDPATSILATFISYTAGFYKNNILVVETFFLGVNQASAASASLWLVDLEEHTATLLNHTSLLPVASPEIEKLVEPQGAPLLAAPLAPTNGRVEAYGTAYQDTGEGAYAAVETGRPIFFDELRYTREGLLASASLSTASGRLQKMTEATTAEYLARLYYNPEWSGVQVAGGATGQGGGAGGGKPQAVTSLNQLSLQLNLTPPTPKQEDQQPRQTTGSQADNTSTAPSIGGGVNGNASTTSGKREGYGSMGRENTGTHAASPSAATQHSTTGASSQPARQAAETRETAALTQKRTATAVETRAEPLIPREAYAPLALTAAIILAALAYRRHSMRSSIG